MKRILWVFFCAVAFISNGQISYVPASPYPIEVEQPDGTKLILLAKGDEKANYAVTEDGFSVVKNQNNIYEFAELDEDGKLAPSGIKARNPEDRGIDEISYLLGIKKNIKPLPVEIDEILKSSAIEKSFPTSGNQRVLLLLIQYPDLDSTYLTTNFNNMMNQPNYGGTGSFHDYYIDCSDNNLNLTVDVFGWYTAANPYLYYGEDNGDDVARELVAEAIDAAEAAGVDFSVYDNDGDNYVDNLMVVHSGPGAEEGKQTQYIWSHNWALWGIYSRTYDGVTIYNYSIQPETRIYFGGMVGIGVFCHEFGHALGLPDLYDTDYSSEGLGNWCLMAGGPWLNNERTPAMMSTWCREKLGWVSPTVIPYPITEAYEGAYTIQPSATTTEAYKILTQNSNEYFLLENKYRTGFNASLPGSGLAIFHVNTNRSNNNNEDLKLVDLEEADGLNQLDTAINRGNAGDLFPGSTFNTLFNDDSYPNAKTYTDESTNIEISDIQLSGSTVLFTINNSVEPQPNLTYNASLNSFAVNGTNIEVDLQVRNTGDANAGSFTVGYYLSLNETVTTSDYLIGTDVVSSLNSAMATNIGLNMDVSTVPGIPNGIYFIGYIIDYLGTVDESDENDNNFINTSLQVEISEPEPNLTFNPPQNSFSVVGTNVEVGLQVINNGDENAGSFNVGYYLSANTTLTTDDYLIGTDVISSLNSSMSTNIGLNVDISSVPALPNGSYYIGYIIDYLETVNESDENDNDFINTSVQVVLDEPVPNLTFNPSENSFFISGTNVEIDLQVQNTGNENAGTFAVGYYLSSNAAVTTSDYLIGTEIVNSLNPGSSTNVGLNVDVSNIPSVPNGSFYVGYIIDYLGTVTESDEEDNDYIYLADQVDNFEPVPNLTYKLSENNFDIDGTNVEISLQVLNNGVSNAGHFTVGYFLSKNASVETSDYLIGSSVISQLNSGESDNLNYAIDVSNVPGLPSGSYYLGYIIDYKGTVGESNENDNRYLYIVTQVEIIREPNLTYDLVFNDFTTDGTIVGINSRIQNNGNGDAGSFNVGYFLSEDTLLTVSDYFIGENLLNGLIFGSHEDIAFEVDLSTIPELPEGIYYLGYIIDYQESVDESLETDNSFISSDNQVIFNLFSNLTYIINENELLINEDLLSFELTITNNGIVSSEICEIGYYISTDPDITISDILLGSDFLPVLEPGESVNESQIIDISNSLPQLESGIYYVGYIIDFQNTIEEENEDDNIFSFVDEDFQYCKENITVLNETICENDSFLYNGIYYREEGEYEFVFSDYQGCDSVIILVLTVNETSTTILDEIICEGEEFYVGENLYSETGIYYNVFENMYGCDSTVILNLEVKPKTTTRVYHDLCEGDIYTLGSHDFSKKGIYYVTLSDQFGCDSTIILYLNVHQNNETLRVEKICEGESFEVNGNFYSTTGIYNDTLVNQFGCDSVVILDLTVIDKVEVSISETICQGDSIQIGSQFFKDTGIYDIVLIGSQGCDSVVTLELNVLPSHEFLITETICEGESYNLAGIDYFVTGIYDTLFTNSYGCDSLVILDLTVLPSGDTIIYEEICQGDSVVIGDSVFYNPGIYEIDFFNSLGCDYTTTLYLTVNTPSETLLEREICEGDSIIIGSAVYKTSGQYVEVLENEFGCDSIITLNLIVNQIQDTTLNITICSGDSVVIGSSVYKTSGNYFDVLTSQSGCDSIVSLDLIVNPVSDTTLFVEIVQDDSLIIGNSVYKATGVYTDVFVNSFGCDSVVITNLTVKESVGTGIQPIAGLNESKLSVYPNPAGDFVNIRLEDFSGDYVLRIISMDGRILYLDRGFVNDVVYNEKINIQNLSDGIYTIDVFSGKNHLTKRLIIR